jgi:flagellar assembly protein FliH
MLSRILSGTDGAAVPPWKWPPATGSPPARGGTPPGAAVASDGQAERDARRIAELEQQVERRTREARDAGYREGEAASRAQSAATLQPVLDRLAKTIQQMAGLRPQIMRDATAELVDLSLAIARRILHRELSVDPAALEGLIAGTLQKLPGQEISRIRIHPELEPGIRQALAREGRSGVPLVADGTLERGAIVIETERGKLDASIETQLAEIGRGLTDRLPEK